MPPARLRHWRRRIAAAVAPPERTTGPPPSPNGASSFHLAWQLAGELVEARATLEVIEPPTIDRLYFWALQVSFVDGGWVRGGAHLGLQHHPDFPRSAAVNWGGYGADGRILDGSPSSLPSTPGDRNTRDFPWRAGVAYELRVYRSPQEGWRGSVRDRDGGNEVVVRDLWGDGNRLAAPLVWSEVFADCDHPTVAVRWRDLVALDVDGVEVRPTALVVSYQSHADGGCANTTSEPDGVGVVQRTSTARTTPPGAVLPPV